MTREKDFEQAAMDYCEDHSHCIYFEAGAEYGYQYAVDKACQYFYDWNKKQVEKHGSKAVLGIREFTISVSGFRKAIED